ARTGTAVANIAAATNAKRIRTPLLTVAWAHPRALCLAAPRLLGAHRRTVRLNRRRQPRSRLTIGRGFITHGGSSLYGALDLSSCMVRGFTSHGSASTGSYTVNP